MKTKSMRRTVLRWLPWLTLALAWLTAAWLMTGHKQQRAEERVLAVEEARAKERLDDFARGLSAMLALRHGIPAALARGTELAPILLAQGDSAALAHLLTETRRTRLEENPQFAALGRRLEQIRQDLSVSVLYLMDARGLCIASSNAGSTESFVGGDFHERPYFRAASQGQQGYQFAVGKVSKVPGLYFSAPVLSGGRFLGAVVVKVDLADFSPWIRQADAFVTDEYGTIVLASDPALNMRILPGSRAARLSPAERLARYHREAFQELRLAQDTRHPELSRLPGREAPLSMQKRTLGDEKLTLVLLWPLPQIEAAASARMADFWLFALLGLGAIAAAAASAAYLRNVGRARRQAEDNELRFRTLFEEAGDAMLLAAATPPGGPILEANAAACALLGYSREELLALNYGEIDRNGAAAMSDARTEHLYRARDGREIPVELHATIMQIEGREAVLTMAHDITTRKAAAAALRQEEERYHLIVDSAGEGFWMLGPDQRTEDVNPTLCAMLGYSREEMLGKSPTEYCDDKNRDIVREQLSYVGLTSNRYYEIELTRRDGSRIPVFFNATTHFDENEEVIMSFAFVTDLRERKRAERSLREALDNLAQAQAIANLGSWRMDLATRRLSWSAETCRIFELPPDMEVTEHFWAPFLSPKDIEQRRNALEKAIEGQAYDLEFPIRLSERTKWLRERVEVLRGADGKALACVGTLQDITESRAHAQELAMHRNHLEELVSERTAQLQAAEIRYRSVLETTPDGFWAVSDDQRLVEVNDAYLRRSGYTRAELLAMTVADLDCLQGEHGVEDNMQRLPEEGSMRFETRHRAKDGSEWPVEVSVSYWRKGRLLFAFLRDISGRKALEAAQEAARQEAERLAQAKSDFLANMSHEIRTPLNGVLGLAQVGYRDNSGRRAQMTFRRILDSGRILLGVVNDILDFSKIEAGRMSVEHIPLDLEELLENLVTLYSERAQAKGLSFALERSPDLPACILGDPLRLAQVLGNLISNAIKFTEWGQVLLRAKKQDGADGAWLRLSVADTGIGMTAAQVERLFTPFEQADSSVTRRFGGTGLGLAISHDIVRLMGGAIRVESSPGQGSHFTVALPLATASLPAPAAKLEAGEIGHRLQGIAILAAEDNDINRMVLEDMLTSEGAQVDLVENGRLALERIMADGPDRYRVVLMDIQMPEMDGMEATRRILELAPRLPIIGQTAHALPEEKERCLAAGMVDHVPKPLELEHLVTAILRQVNA